MPLLHKFYQTNFQNGFKTENTILKTNIYAPEVIFIGTYNHGWSWNPSDFFYGRGMYMWPVLGNLFLHNANQLTHPRNQNNDDPNFEQIFEICAKGKIVFADIVKGIKDDVTAIENNGEKYVLVNNELNWPIIDEKGNRIKEYSDKYLDIMGRFNWLDDNVKAITKYINETPSIKHVYFTFNTGAWVVTKKNEICNKLRKGVSFFSVFTPTASGFRRNLEAPFDERAWSLTHCWVWNGLEHQCPITKPNFGHLDHNWLVRNGVTPNNF